MVFSLIWREPSCFSSLSSIAPTTLGGPVLLWSRVLFFPYAWPNLSLVPPVRASDNLYAMRSSSFLRASLLPLLSSSLSAVSPAHRPLRASARTFPLLLSSPIWWPLFFPSLSPDHRQGLPLFKNVTLSELNFFKKSFQSPAQLFFLP